MTREQVEQLRAEFVGRKWPNDELPSRIVVLADDWLALVEAAREYRRLIRPDAPMPQGEDPGDVAVADALDAALKGESA